MQTTLLGIAIALILALVAALVGPSVVDWNRFRPNIEAEATRLIGTPVRITGKIDANILPSPSLTLRGLEVGPSHAGSSIRMRSLEVELNLGALVRGQWRAQDLHLVGPDFNLGIDGAGNLALPPIMPGFDPDRLSIEKLNIEDGHAVLADSRSGSRVVLDKLWFNGDLKSLLGPIRGDGAFVIAGDLYAYRVSAGRAEEGAVKVRLNIDPVERPLSVESEGTLSFAGATPKFDGSMVLSRPAGIALPNGRIVASDPWKLTSKVKASAASALFEAIDFQYGPEERALRLAGTAELKFGDKPRFEGILAASQIDLDRTMAADAGRQLPFAALKTLGDGFSGAMKSSVPARIGVSIDTLTLAGSTIQNVRGDIRSDGEAWTLEGFELRAPGYTQVTLSGKLDLAPGRFGFAGPVSVDSTDPTALMAWLEGNSTPSAARMKPFRGRGDVTLGSETIAIDRLSAELDRKHVEGRFAYIWAAGDKPARLETELNAAELDLDALLAFVDTARGSTTFETPREVTLGLGIGKAVVAGMEATNINARFRRDATGLHVEKLAIGNFGGNSFDVSGRIDATASPPQGALNVRFDARDMAGVVVLAEKLAPDSAAWVRRLAQRVPELHLNTTLALEQSGLAKLSIDGLAGDVRINMRGESARSNASSADWQNIAAGDLKLDATFASDKGQSIVNLLNLGGVIAADAGRPGQLTVAATGPLDNLQLESRLVAGGLDASGKGPLRLGSEMKGELKLTANVNAQPLRRGGARVSEPLSVTLNGNLGFTAQSLMLNDFSGTVAGVPARGKLAFDFSKGIGIEGQVDLDKLDGPVLLAALIGLPASPDARGWSAEPFRRGALDSAEGRVVVRAAQIEFTPTLTLRQARGALKFNGNEISFTDIEGNLADGRAKGQISFNKRDAGLTMNGRMRVSNADAAILVGGEGKPVTGRLTLQLDVEGVGLSPQTLIGSLSGNGLVSLSQARFAALNSKVFETSTRAVDEGAAIDMTKIGDAARSTLDSGALAVPSADGVITIAHGQLRLTNLITRADGADLSVTGSADLTEQTMSARLALSSNKGSQPANDRPAVSVFLSGPIAAPKRAVDVSALTAWLTLRAVEQQSKQIEAIEAARQQSTTAKPQEDPGVTQSVAPTQTQAPALPPAIVVPNLNIMENKPAARPPARAQTGTAAPPRPVPAKPLPLLPGSSYD